MFTRKSLLFAVFGFTAITIILSILQPDSWTVISDRLFLYGMALLVFAAFILLFSGKFGFVVVRGFRLLFKGTPLGSYDEDNMLNKEYSDSFEADEEQPVSTIKKSTWFILAAFIAGFVNVFLSIILILLFS